MFVVNTPDKRERTLLLTVEEHLANSITSMKKKHFFVKLLLYIFVSRVLEKKTVLEAVVSSRRRVAKIRECFEVTKRVPFEFIKIVAKIIFYC